MLVIDLHVGDDPYALAARLKDLPHLALLESAMRDARLGRWSYLAADPFAVFSARDGRAAWNGIDVPGEPLKALRRAFDVFRHEPRPDIAPFTGGAIGWFGYEFGRSLEELPAPAIPEPAIADLMLGFYDVVVVFDHETGVTRLVSTGLPERNPEARMYRARVRADEFLERLAQAPAPSGRGAAKLAFRSNFERPAYEAAVAKVVDYILAGDIFQANLAQRFSAALPDGFDPFAFYGRLRQANPATFAAFLDFDAVQIASSSPERFLELAGGRVESRPIKGTIRRSPDPAEDAARAAALEGSEKDRAENVMIVDLLRNDLSRVCADCTVEVPVLCGLESYASVHHLVSVVTGRLQPGRDGLDLIAASFPGGSITGAPKIRAMEIITELEGNARGVYCGSIGWLGFDGAMDLNIAIRTVTFRDGEAVFHAGGGITALSDPAAEYDETLAKAERLFRAFEPDR